MSWQYIAIRTIAETVANVEMKLVDKDGKSIIKHEALDALQSVNNYMSKFDLFYAIEVYRLLMG